MQKTNCYRLSAYFLPFKNVVNDSYYAGTSLETIYNIYEFDREMRNILLGALETIEINLRSKISYYHAHKYGPLGYLQAENFNSRHNHVLFEEKFYREINNNNKVAFVKHHHDKYDGNFPIWVSIELFTFGMLSYFYSDLLTSDQKSISSLMGVHYKHLSSWLRCCTDLRNICAHYGRLYYRVFSAAPSGLELDELSKRRLWGAILVAKSLFPSKEEWNNNILADITLLFEKYGDSIVLNHISFPNDWVEQLRA